jgi:hypothetical protein
MGLALPCLIRIVAACPRSRLIRVCASHNKTFPGRGAFILIQPGRRDPCSQDWPGYAGSERPFWVSLAGASGRRSVLSGGTPGPVPRLRPGGRLPAEATSRTLRLPGSRVPGKRTAGPRTGKRTVGPRTEPSGGQRCDPVAPPPPLSPELQGVQGVQGVGADPRRQRAALEVARHSAAHRRLPTGSAPCPPAKLMNPGAR